MSRPKERIPIFLELIKGKEYQIVKDIFKFHKDDLNKFVFVFNATKEQWKTNWFRNPDLRFSQVLVNYGLLANMPGSWYYMEEWEILEKLGIPTREYLLWGQNYGKDMNLLPKTLFNPIKDLTTDHIRAILDGGYAKNPKYIKCFKEELKLRE